MINSGFAFISPTEGNHVELIDVNEQGLYDGRLFRPQAHGNLLEFFNVNEQGVDEGSLF